MKLPLINFADLAKNSRRGLVAAKNFGIKHAPLALVIAGGVGLVATAVTSYQAAKKVDKTLEKFEEMKEDGIVPSKVEIATEVAKDIAIPVLLGVTSCAAIGLSYAIQNNRLKAVTAALAVITEEHSRYRKRAKEILDEETFKRLDTPHDTRKITITDEDGNEIETTVEVPSEGLFYGAYFKNSNLNSPGEPEYNERTIQEIYNEILIPKMAKWGELTFPYVLEQLGFEVPSAALPFFWSDTDQFYIEWDTFDMWDEEAKAMVPQTYVRWKRPRNRYAPNIYAEADEQA